MPRDDGDDLYATDREAEVERLKSLGATNVHWDKMPNDADFTILADPRGEQILRGQQVESANGVGLAVSQ